MSDYVIYTDGASKGNPGPASIGAVVINGAGKVLEEYSQAIGKTTNNVAEYQAVIFALKKVKALFGKKRAEQSEILIKSDSKLLVKQLNGEFKLKDEKIKEFFIEIWNLKMDFKKVSFENIPREKNERADALANQALGGGLL